MSEDKNTEVEQAAIEPEAIEGADELAAVEPAGTDIDLVAGDEDKAARLHARKARDGLAQLLLPRARDARDAVDFTPPHRQ